MLCWANCELKIAFLILDNLWPTDRWYFVGPERGQHAAKLWPDPHGLPNSSRCHCDNMFLGKRCNICGLYGHRELTCYDNTTDLVCDYPLCGVVGKHLPPTCPVLFHQCESCGMRGHNPEDHGRYVMAILLHSLLCEFMYCSYIKCCSIC